MIDEKWEQLIDLAQKHFKGVKQYTEDLIMDTQDGPIKQGVCEVVEFDHADGKRYKLVRENKPIVLEKKELYSHRAGQSAQTQYKFSDSEFSHKLRVYKEVDFDEWDEITLDRLGL